MPARQEVKEMINNSHTRSFKIFFGFLLILSVCGFTVMAQRMAGTAPSLIIDTANNPHDFSDAYYKANGIKVRSIIDRRTGTDGLSVFGATSDPDQSTVRVIATIPALDHNGMLVFWYPLGELADTGFADTKVGAVARQTAQLFPIYVFPDTTVLIYSASANTRQAPLVDNSWKAQLGKESNPLGLREILIVNYTEKAFTKEAVETMAYFAKKNGLANDDTPLIKSLDDIQYLLKIEFITLQKASSVSDKFAMGDYAISPVIADPRNGTIAADAFLWMSTKDGSSLPGEQVFVSSFSCLQKTGDWCE